MFQSFPLGDKSSVNLRGEYHAENVTTYETSPADGDIKMGMDAPVEGQVESKGTPKTADSRKADKVMTSDELYPFFWALQESFSQPKKLFEAANLSSFKESLSATLKVFQTIHNDRGSRKSSEDTRRSLKRKRDDSQDGDDNGEDDSATAFNPKYLTSRDLFDLEVSPNSSIARAFNVLTEV